MSGAALNVGLMKTDQYESRYLTLRTTARCPYCISSVDPN